MADSKLADLTEDTAPLLDDWLYKVVNAGTSGSDRKVKLSNVRGWTAVRKSADESVTSSTTLQDDDALLFAVASSEVWIFRFVLFYEATTSGDCVVAVTVPAGATARYGVIGPASTVTSASGDGNFYATASPPGGSTFGGRGSGNLLVASLEGYIANGGTAGNVTLQWTQGASDATATIVKAGSSLNAHKVA